MTEPARRRASYEDVLAAPPHVVAEVLHGHLHTSPRPSLAHAFAVSSLGGLLGGFGPSGHGRGGPGGWLILFEPELHLGDDIVVPDLAGWRRERMPELTGAAFATRAPDWVCEVLSPSTQAIDRTDKMDIYLREQVAHLWLVDPAARTLEVYAARNPASQGDRDAEPAWLRLATHRDHAVAPVPPFDVIDLELGLLWAG